MFDSQAGRHFWFAENLIQQGYPTTIFSANTYHKKNQTINLDNKKFRAKKAGEVPFVFVKTTKTVTRGLSRIKNMVMFALNLPAASKEFAKASGPPDIIIASSVHPLTLISAIRVAKKFNVPCICEIRDLWPLTLIEFKKIKENSLMSRLLYKGEKFIYKKADKLIFTMEGGVDYIKDQGWSSEINVDKIYHINNGVNLKKFNLDKKSNNYRDHDLDNDKIFKLIYTGSLGEANEMDFIIKVAKEIKLYTDIKILVFGDGPNKQALMDRIQENNLKNVIFKGSVDRKYIPNILSKGDLNIMSGKNTDLYKYGISLNKMFEYFASGRPTLSNIQCGYDLLKRYECGKTISEYSPKAFAEGILKYYHMDELDYDTYCINSINAAKDFDFKILSKKLIEIIDLL